VALHESVIGVRRSAGGSCLCGGDPGRRLVRGGPAASGLGDPRRRPAAPRRQLGVLFATGLLIPNPLAGWAVLAGIAIRMTALRIKGAAANTPMEVLAAGFIAGDALFGFFDSVLKTKPPTGNDG
jgi:hypothetical protein